MRAFSKTVGATTVALAMTACVPDYVKQDNAPVMLIIASINDGLPLISDVFDTTIRPVAPDIVSVAVANRSKNPNVDIPQIPMHLLIQRYEVRYFRTDGRNTEGVDIPFRFSGGIANEVDVAIGGVADIPVEVVRAQAKLEPPLRNLRTGPPSGIPNFPLSGAMIITCFADITLHAQTIDGRVVKATGRLQIDFADWPE